MQTSSALSSARLRKKALTDGPDFKILVKLGCTLEKADKHASTMMVTEHLCSVNNRDAYAGGAGGSSPSCPLQGLNYFSAKMLIMCHQ